MLDQQGLTELVHSSCSEQVAYLLVERASLLEMSDPPAELTRDDPPGAQRPVPDTDTCQVRGTRFICNYNRGSFYGVF